MRGYLLDTNVLGHYFAEHPKVKVRIDSLADDDRLFVSAVTLGEVEFGHSISPTTDPARRDEFECWLRNTFPKAARVEVSTHAAYAYGKIRAEIWRKYPPKSPKANHTEQCFDHASGHELGIEENDLWIAAQAVERSYTLVSSDKMERICEAAWPELHLENWLI